MTDVIGERRGRVLVKHLPITSDGGNDITAVLLAGRPDMRCQARAQWDMRIRLNGELACSRDMRIAERCVAEMCTVVTLCAEHVW